MLALAPSSQGRSNAGTENFEHPCTRSEPGDRALRDKSRASIVCVAPNLAETVVATGHHLRKIELELSFGIKARRSVDGRSDSNLNPARRVWAATHFEKQF
jgi:hypothetical protein